jgi:hypothetical protein
MQKIELFDQNRMAANLRGASELTELIDRLSSLIMLEICLKSRKQVVP